MDGGEIRGAGNAWICPEVHNKAINFVLLKIELFEANFDVLS